MNINNIYFICQQTIICMIPLLIVAIGGTFSERGGVLNFSLEGIMLSGAFCGTLYLSGVENGTNATYLVALLLAGLGGMLAILPHAISSISLKGNQVISGMAINLLVPPVTIILARALVGRLQISFKNTYIIQQVPGLSKIPVIGDIFFKNAYITTLIGFILLFVAIVVFNKTRFGVHLRACGEDPNAAASMSINVTAIRYAGVMISGFIGGVGGLAFLIPSASEYAASVAGYGYLAVAVVIFGQWNPMKILGAAVFFGFMKTLANIYTTIPFLVSLGVSNYWFKMVPYAATIIVLIFTSKKTQQPRALGAVYDQGRR